MPFPIDEKFIKETENNLLTKFPDSFRNKMVKQNGGELLINDEDWQLHPFLDKSDNKRISRTCNDIVKATNTAKEWSNFPKNAISIGENGYGDHIIFLQFENNKELDNSVYFWNHETGDSEKIADDFSELLE